MLTLTSFKEVQVTGTLNCLSDDEGLCNEGLHGFHVHQKGTIRNDAGEVDCGLTGSHFQVPGQVHSFPADPNRYFIWRSIVNTHRSGKFKVRCVTVK